MISIYLKNSSLFFIVIACLIISSCKLNRTNYLTINVPKKCNCEIFIIPDKKSVNSSNIITLDSTGIFLLNYSTSARFEKYELKIIRNGKDISDDCQYANSSFSPRGINNSKIICKSITLPECVNSNIDSEKYLEEILNTYKISQ